MSDEQKKQDIDEFKHNVKTWLHLDDKISDLQQKIKAYKNQQKELNPLIIHFMNKRDIQEVNSNEGNIRFNVAKTRASLSNKKLQSSISSYFNNDDQTQNLIEHIMNNREIKETVKLKRFE
tara:strand:+ start:1283 stop:1645 length:363 start_codon:yes stop_codon:yes gene_type:complete